MLEAGNANGGNNNSGSTIFGGLAREEFIQARVHRRLHPQIGGMSDEQILELGKMSFNLQITTVEEQGTATKEASHGLDPRRTQEASHGLNPSDMFGGVS